MWLFLGHAAVVVFGRVCQEGRAAQWWRFHCVEMLFRSRAVSLTGVAVVVAKVVVMMVVMIMVLMKVVVIMTFFLLPLFCFFFCFKIEINFLKLKL